MTHDNRQEHHEDAGMPPQPSQAEGDRGTVEADLRERGLDQGADAAARSEQATAERSTDRSERAPGPADKPSQAEGDRETVEKDLRERGTGS